MSIRVKAVEYAYGRIAALRGVSGSFPTGAVTAVLGANASGKSTLLRCIAGVLRPDAGVVSIDDEPVHRMGARHRAARLAYVPQQSSVAASFTVREVVELGRYALPADWHRIDAALEQTQTFDLADRPFASLSVGQQQRVTLARALAQVSPDRHLVLDEPTAAMDLRHQGLALALMRNLARQGATVVVVLHDVTVAAAVADEVWALRDGRLAASGPAGQVLTPTVLQGVFDAPFTWLRDESGRRRLAVDHDALAPAGPGDGALPTADSAAGTAPPLH